MATVYLHIGLPKTGTTAIQNFLASNEKALEAHRSCFPDFKQRFFRSDHSYHIDSVRNGHFLVKAWERLTSDAPNETYVSIMNQLGELGTSHDKIILSDESLWLFGNKFPESWSVLKRDLERNGLELRVIAYLRRQDNFALSYYRQMVRGVSTSLSFHDYQNIFRDKYCLDYYGYLNMLSDVIGRENVFFRVYEKTQFKGDEHSIFSDFLDILGFSLKDGFTMQKEEYNPSLDDTLLELRRTLNQLPGPERYNRILARSLRGMLADREPEELLKKTSFFHPGEQAVYLESFAESNRRLAGDYFGKKDGRLFDDTTGMELPEYHVAAEDLLRDTILFYARAVQLLEEQNKALRAELTEVRENVLLYRLKRKIRYLLGKDDGEAT